MPYSFVPQDIGQDDVFSIEVGKVLRRPFEMKFYAGCPQGLPLELEKPVDAVDAILSVTQQGVADKCHMGPYLMRFARNQLNLQQGIRSHFS